MIRFKQGRASLGFTLVEMVTVILILGILVVGVSSFVIFGTRIFVESTSIDQVLSQSRFAIERLTRELRGALPNSIRLSTNGTSSQCLEFVPIQASASYTQVPIHPAVKQSSAQVFSASQVISAGEFMTVYPLTAADIYTNPLAPISDGRIFSIDSVSSSAGVTTVDFGRNVRFDEASPRKRYFVVNQPVSYCVFEGGALGGSMYRYTGYGIDNATQPLPSAMGSGVLMAENIVNSLSTDAPFRISPSNLRNNAIVQIQPQFVVNGQNFRYQHQVQVINVP